MTYFWWTLGIWTVVAFALVIYDACVFEPRKLVSIRVLMAKQILMLPFLVIMWLLALIAVLFLLVIRGGHLGRDK